MNKKMKDTLVQDAFIQAYGKEHPDAGLIVHTDQGSQFTSGNFRSLLAKYHAIQSTVEKEILMIMLLWNLSIEQ